MPVGVVIGVMVEEEKDVGAFGGYAPPAGAGASGGGGGDGAIRDAATAAAATAAGGSAPTTTKAVSKKREDLSGGRMWPSVRRLLAESGLDPLTITPTGARGALVKGDVLAAMGLCDAPKAASSNASNVATTTTTTTMMKTPKTPAPPAPPPKRDPRAQEHEDVPTTSVRKVIASRLLESKTTVRSYTGPHTTALAW